jgi:hypothetical protein
MTMPVCLPHLFADTTAALLFQHVFHYLPLLHLPPLLASEIYVLCFTLTCQVDCKIISDERDQRADASEDACSKRRKLNNPIETSPGPR